MTEFINQFYVAVGWKYVHLNCHSNEPVLKLKSKTIWILKWFCLEKSFLYSLNQIYSKAEISSWEQVRSDARWCPAQTR